MGTCFSRVGLDVPTSGGDCVCGEFVRFDLVHQRAKHFMVCPAVDEICMAIPLPSDIDEAAVKVGIDAFHQD